MWMNVKNGFALPIHEAGNWKFSSKQWNGSVLKLEGGAEVKKAQGFYVYVNLKR